MEVYHWDGVHNEKTELNESTSIYRPPSMYLQIKWAGESIQLV